MAYINSTSFIETAQPGAYNFSTSFIDTVQQVPYNNSTSCYTHCATRGIQLLNFVSYALFNKRHTMVQLKFIDTVQQEVYNRTTSFYRHH